MGVFLHTTVWSTWCALVMIRATNSRVCVQAGGMEMLVPVTLHGCLLFL